MRPPSLPPMRGAMPKPPVQQQKTVNFMGVPIPIPQELQSRFPAYQPPPMTGNLMPVPEFAPAPDYVAPPPKPVDPNAPFINQYGYWEYPGETIDFGSSGND
jgi:hypothetical protein